MVAAPENRDLPYKEKEHTHTHTAQKEKKKKKETDGQVKKTAKRVTDSTLPYYTVQW